MTPRLTATIHGWLLLLPAMALLALFTHWPAVATFIDSFYSTPRPRRPMRYIGLDNYTQIVADPVFWRSLWNNMWFAIGTIPVSIGLLGTDWALAPTALITMVLAVVAATFLLTQVVWGALWRPWLLSGSAILYIGYVVYLYGF